MALDLFDINFCWCCCLPLPLQLSSSSSLSLCLSSLLLWRVQLKSEDMTAAAALQCHRWQASISLVTGQTTYDWLLLLFGLSCTTRTTADYCLSSFFSISLFSLSFFHSINWLPQCTASNFSHICPYCHRWHGRVKRSERIIGLLLRWHFSVSQSDNFTFLPLCFALRVHSLGHLMRVPSLLCYPFCLEKWLFNQQSHTHTQPQGGDLS